MREQLRHSEPQDIKCIGLLRFRFRVLLVLGVLDTCSERSAVDFSSSLDLTSSCACTTPVLR